MTKPDTRRPNLLALAAYVDDNRPVVPYAAFEDAASAGR